MFLLIAKSWHNAFDSGRPSLAIALDIAEASDHKWHWGFLAKLEQLGITGRLLEVFSSILQGGSLRVVVSGSTLAIYLTEESLPQGSVLDPIL